MWNYASQMHSYLFFFILARLHLYTCTWQWCCCEYRKYVCDSFLKNTSEVWFCRNFALKKCRPLYALKQPRARILWGTNLFHQVWSFDKSINELRSQLFFFAAGTTWNLHRSQISNFKWNGSRLITYTHLKM